MEKAFVIQELVRTDEQNKPTHKGIFIPNGKWVLNVGTHFRSEREWDLDGDDAFSETEETTYAVVGGVEPVRHVLDRSRGGIGHAGSSGSWGSGSYMLVADRPFGVISVEKTNGEPSPFLEFTAAREVHKGELGRFPLAAAPKYAREGREPATWKNEDLRPGEQPIPMRRLKRHHARWARLVEVAALIGRPHERLVEDFYAFADSHGHGLPVVFAANRDEIHGQVLPPGTVKSFTEREFPKLFDRNPATIWVRQGFAKTVLCLHALGYQPGTTLKGA
ncbi:hypothetical protein IT087_02700 [Candidatus Uhrbacteria bacterium]|nr:hypothetical protein [Candidatus Uhrbacteria bacterium]